jgi:hypothetical protein
MQVQDGSGKWPAAAAASKGVWNGGLQEESKDISLCEGGSDLSYMSINCMPDKGGSKSTRPG